MSWQRMMERMDGVLQAAVGLVSALPGVAPLLFDYRHPDNLPDLVRANWLGLLIAVAALLLVLVWHRAVRRMRAGPFTAGVLLAIAGLIACAFVQINIQPTIKESPHHRFPNPTQPEKPEVRSYLVLLPEGFPKSEMARQIVDDQRPPTVNGLFGSNRSAMIDRALAADGDPSPTRVAAYAASYWGLIIFGTLTMILLLARLTPEPRRSAGEGHGDPDES